MEFFQSFSGVILDLNWSFSGILLECFWCSSGVLEAFFFFMFLELYWSSYESFLEL